MNGKKWYQSRTVWTNIVALVTAVGLWAQADFALSEVGTTVFPAVLALVNLILRFLTHQPIE